MALSPRPVNLVDAETPIKTGLGSTETSIPLITPLAGCLKLCRAPRSGSDGFILGRIAAVQGTQDACSELLVMGVKSKESVIKEALGMTEGAPAGTLGYR